MRRGRSRPPRLAEEILRWCLPKGMVERSILADLREEYEEDLRTMPSALARLRYLQNGMSVVGRFATGRRNPQRHPQKPHRKNIGGVMSSLWLDLRTATRLLARRPGLTLAAITSLGLGIGANTGIFTLVNTILLQPLPYPDSHELVEAYRIDPEVTGPNPSAERIANLWGVPLRGAPRLGRDEPGVRLRPPTTGSPNDPASWAEPGSVSRSRRH